MGETPPIEKPVYNCDIPEWLMPKRHCSHPLFTTFDVKTSKGPSTIVNGKSIGGTGNKLKPKQKEIGVRLVVVEGEEIRIIEARKTIIKRQKVS